MAERQQSRSGNRQPRSSGRLTLIIQKGNPKVKKEHKRKDGQKKKREEERERKAARMGWEGDGRKYAEGDGVETVCPPAGERRRKGKEERKKRKGCRGAGGRQPEGDWCQAALVGRQLGRRRMTVARARRQTRNGLARWGSDLLSHLYSVTCT